MKLKEFVAAGTSLSVGMLGITRSTEVSKADVSIPPVDARPAPVFFASDDASDTTMSIRLPNTEADEEWTSENERRYSTLAARKAVGTLRGDDLVEFEALRKQRRMERNPISAEEAMFQFRRREMEAKILKDLHEYVEFLGTARRS